MKNTLYLECYSGISGDMTVAALLDLGASKEALMEVLESLPVQGFQVKISRVLKSGIDACDFNVILDEEHDNHDHDMEYLYGHEYTSDELLHYSHEHIHKEEHNHSHEHEGHSHSHGHEGHPHSHEHRGMKEICEIIAGCNMTEGARELAVKIFTILAEAEAKAHNVPVDEVHFHEVGAVDSIVDIIAAAVCIDNLNIQDVIVPELWEGKGTVRCQHGILPVPVPAVTNIIQANHLNVRIMEQRGEYITPTGAAIVAAIKTSDVLPEGFQIQQVGIGAGKREYDGPGIVRAMLIKMV